MTSFLEKTRDARKVLVCDLGFLGDTIHLFPSLRIIRDAYPQAELHVMAADHVKDLLRLLPWVNKICGYPRFPTSPPWYRLLPLIKTLRREKFDAVINLNGSNRSSFLTRFTGSPLRLGRTPQRSGGLLWPLCFTDRVTVPYDETPVFTQRLRCLEAAGFFVPLKAGFGIVGPVVPAETQDAVDQQLDGISGFGHLSPFTTADHRELHPDDLAYALNTFATRFPEIRWVLTCAANERERAKLAALLPRLTTPPWKVFQGTLSPLELGAVMRRARIHLGGDSGGIHLASLFGVPNVTWFQEPTPTLSKWMPRRLHDAVLHASPDGTGFLRLLPEQLVTAASRILS